MHCFVWIFILLLSAEMACFVRAFAVRQYSPSRFCTTTTSGCGPIIGSSNRHDNAQQTWRLFSINKKRVVFLGTPEVAADSLKLIYEDSKREDSIYEIVGVVTQPAKRRKRMGEVVASPVGELAELLGIAVMAPESVRIPNIYLYIFLLRDLAYPIIV